MALIGELFRIEREIADAPRGHTARPCGGGQSRPVVDRFFAWCDARVPEQLEPLPDAWRQYDLIVTASMLEYLPRDKLADALRGLRGRLGENGRLVLFITRRNWLTRPLIGRWWQSNIYSAEELRVDFRRAGFAECTFRSFPPAARYLALWGYIIEAGH